MLAKYFAFDRYHTSYKTEIVAGLTTYLTMAYIIFVNPNILAEAGMDTGAVFVATCLAAAIGCFIMGIWGKLPVALAPGMGLNAFFAYGVVLGMGHSWQTALGAVFISGVIFVLLSLFKIRKWIINAIPNALKHGIVAGIGAFLAFIALKSAGIIVDNPATFVSLGDLTEFGPAMAILSFFIIIAMVEKNIPGGVMLAILIVSAIAVLTGHVDYTGIVSAPPSLAPTVLQLDIMGALELSMVSVIFAFLFVDLFDTTGTLIAVTKRAGLTEDHGEQPYMGKALFADSTATVAGALLGTSSTTSYVESTTGVVAGGRTGLVAVVVGVLFLLSLFFAPLAGMIPAYATAGAMMYVAVLMLFTLQEVNWADITEAAPVAVILLMMPLTFSIADGIALGFITYVVAKIIGGKARTLNLAVIVIAAALLAKIIFLS